MMIHFKSFTGDIISYCKSLIQLLTYLVKAKICRIEIGNTDDAVNAFIFSLVNLTYLFLTLSMSKSKIFREKCKTI